MKVSHATRYFFDYHTANSKKNTARRHLYVLEKFSEQYGDRELQSITTDELLSLSKS